VKFAELAYPTAVLNETMWHFRGQNILCPLLYIFSEVKSLNHWSTPLQKVIVSCTVTQKRLSWLYQLHSSIGQIVEMGKNRYRWGSALFGFCHYCKGSVESVLFGSSSVQPQIIWVRFWSGTVLIFFVLSSVLFGSKWVRSFDGFNFSAVMLKHFNTKLLHANGISVIW